MEEFDYVKLTDLNETLDFLDKNQNIYLLQGGTDLLVDVRHNMKHPDCLADIKEIPELNNLQENDEGVEIGAAVPLNKILQSRLLSEQLPILYQGCHEIASYPIRNRATLGGNVCTASPAADTSSPLYCLGAKVKAVSKNGEREIPIEEFFQGPKKNALESGEIVVSIVIPKPYPQGKGVYYKLSRTNSVDLASVGVAIQEDKGKVAIAVNACAPTPIRAQSVEKLINEQDESDYEKAARAVEQDINPIDDLRGSADYRIRTTKVLIKRGLEDVFKGGK